MYKNPFAVTSLLLALSLFSCDDSTTASNDPTPNVPQDTVPLPLAHEVLYVSQWGLIDGDLPTPLCNGIDSTVGDTLYFSFWSKMSYGFTEFYPKGFLSGDTLSLWIGPLTDTALKDTDSTLKYRFIQKTVRPSTGIETLLIRSSRLAAPITKADSARGYLDLRNDAAIPFRNCSGV